MKRRDTVLVLIFGLAVLALGWLWWSPPGVERVPDISLRTIDGREIVLGSLRGRPLLVNFWATDCPGCIREIPDLISLYDEFAPRGFELIAVAMPYDRPDHVLAFAQSRKLPFPVALDPMGEAVRAFGQVRLTPTSFLVAPDGRVVEYRIGEIDPARMRAAIRGMLGEG